MSLRTARRRAARSEQAPESPWKAAHERARDRASKREAVLRAAARAFRQRGVHNTTLDDIAAFLNVTKPTIYYYVSNKEQIIFECFRLGIGRIAAAIDELTRSEGTGRAKLAALARQYAQVMASDFGWCMVRVEDHDLSPAVARRLKSMKSEIDQGIRGLIRAGIADGSIRPCDPKMTAFALAGALNGIGRWYRGGEPLSPDDIATRFIELFERGLEPARDPEDACQRTS
ncbi:MAG TPA: TetR/AcrR family transcriptional regulator [Steroidobacteraceae bacterium]|nr:TetR/AcrR family transcriptional regulator [Steroidobacteraceae bacterium]